VFRKDARPFLFVAIVAMLALLGCIRLPTLRFNSPFGQTDWVELRDSQVLSGPDSAFVVTVVNQKEQSIWVRFLIDEIEGANDCADAFRLDARSEYTYRCAQPRLVAGAQYRAELTVFKDFGNTKVAERINRIVSLEASDDGGFVLVGRPAS